MSEGILVGKDDDSDIAVIKTDVNFKMLPIEVGNSSDVRIGDKVLAKTLSPIRTSELLPTSIGNILKLTSVLITAISESSSLPTKIPSLISPFL